jgi:hypothetical protein
MSNCIIDGGYTLGCSSIGGVEKVWIGTYSPSQNYTLDIDNVITAVTSGQTVYLMEQDMEYAGLNQTGTFSRENGTVFYESVLSLKFIELSAELRNLIVALGRAPLFAVVKSNAGAYYLCGLESAGRATAGVASLGIAQGDLNGATLEVTWKTPNGVFLLDAGVLGTDIPIG